MTKTMFDEIQVFLLVCGGRRRKILVENCILNFESVFSSFFASPRRPSAKNPGENDILHFESASFAKTYIF